MRLETGLWTRRTACWLGLVLAALAPLAGVALSTLRRLTGDFFTRSGFAGAASPSAGSNSSDSTASFFLWDPCIICAEPFVLG